jgi:thiamine-phosphate pyrophosphorylase
MKRPAVPRFHLVGPLDVVPPERYVEIAADAARGGCDAVHLRLPELGGGQILHVARQLTEILAEFQGTQLIVNDRLDIALLAHCDGVQLGELSFTPEEARQLLGRRLFVGRSVHSLDGALRAEQAGADYVLAGNVFVTPSKPDEPGRGLEWLGLIAGRLRIPVLGLGGITAEQVSEVLQTGAYGVAIGREILSADDPSAVAREIAARVGLA